MHNSDIKKYATKKNVFLWQIADKLGITDSTFSRKLRKPFTKEKKEEIFKIIDEIAKMERR